MDKELVRQRLIELGVDEDNIQEFLDQYNPAEKLAEIEYSGKLFFDHLRGTLDTSMEWRERSIIAAENLKRNLDG